MVEENGGARDVWNDFRIDYNDYAHLCDESTDAYTNPLTAHQHFCPIFYEYPDLLELTCAELGDHISSRMDNAAGVVLHEATHVLHPPLSGVRFADMWHHQSLRQNWKGSVCQPFPKMTLLLGLPRISLTQQHDRLGVSFHDYADGPTACVALALNNAPATLVNPDSYMWFTIESISPQTYPLSSIPDRLTWVQIISRQCAGGATLAPVTSYAMMFRRFARTSRGSLRDARARSTRTQGSPCPARVGSSS